MVIATPTQSVPIARPPHQAPLRALVAPSTWLTAAHLLLDVVVGTACGFVLVMGLAFSILLLPLALLGVPVWIITAWVSAGLARLERVRYRVLLGVRIEIPAMPPVDRNPIRYGGILWRDPGVRRRALHQVLAGPMGLVTAGATYLLLSAAPALMAMPLLGFMAPAGDGTTFGIPFADSDGGRTLLAGLGLLLLLTAPAALRGLAALDIALARTLLGPAPATLARRVDELERSRARVVDAGEAERRKLERDLHDGTQ